MSSEDNMATREPAEYGDDDKTHPSSVLPHHANPDPVEAGLRQAETTLRKRLAENPNDQQAFATLARLVSLGAHYDEIPDPLTADELPAGERERINTALWALADEFVGNSRAWYPLIQLARLSLDEDRESAVRRLKTAVQREESGQALFESLQMLRRANLPGEAVQLGVGAWDPANHIADAGRQLVRAACEAHRPDEARRLLAALRKHHGDEDFTDLDVAVQSAVSAGE
ncbi:MAG: hypothetical protein Q4Q03_05545 [Bowdeniella nasicola]|nr:hypothetical protein [Bowdeniella nasicola]